MAHHVAVLSTERAVDDRVDDRVQRQVIGRCIQLYAVRMAQQNMQKLVADNSLDVSLAPAVFFQELEIDQ